MLHGNCNFWLKNEEPEATATIDFKMSDQKLLQLLVGVPIGNFNFWLQYLQLKLASTNSCKNRNQIATGKKTQLIVAIFATRIFAVQCTFMKGNFQIQLIQSY